MAFFVKTRNCHCIVFWMSYGLSLPWCETKKGHRTLACFSHRCHQPTPPRIIFRNLTKEPMTEPTRTRHLQRHPALGPLRPRSGNHPRTSGETIARGGRTNGEALRRPPGITFFGVSQIFKKKKRIVSKMFFVETKLSLKYCLWNKIVSPKKK